MMLPTRTNIYVATVPVDMRRSFDGLAAAAREYAGLEPRDGALFVFFNRRVDRAKLLWWDRTGYSILYKRLERGTFRVPQPVHIGATHVGIAPAELAIILDGVGLTNAKQRVRTR